MIRDLSFVFTPTRLVEALAEIERRLPRPIEERFQRAIFEADARELLKRLESIPADAIADFAAELISREVWALVFALPQLPAEAVADKCWEVIRLRWRPPFAFPLWKGLQRYPDQVHVAGLLRDALEAGQHDFFSGAPDRLPDLKRALGAASLTTALGEVLVQRTAPYASQASELDLLPKAELYRAAQRFCLMKGERQTFAREQPGYLVAALSELREADLVRAVDRYLTVLPPEALHEEVMAHIRWRLGSVWENGRLNPRWEPVSEHRRHTFQRWWNERDIDRFFRGDNERHQFWKQYTPAMLEVHKAPAAEALIMIFQGVIVVEFARVGNAAYLYHRGVFERLFGSIAELRSARRPAQLKNPSAFDRVIHLPGWQGGAHRRMQTYLRKGS